MISHYNADLCDHINRHRKGQIGYFSHKIQNEFLTLISSKVREDILKDVKDAKYFSIIFDATPDISHKEQMTQIVRYVKMTETGPEITESFIDFFIIRDKTGLGISEEILKKLENDGLDIKNCRGQSYDNGANMAGIYKGVQTRILTENKLACFVPCSAHSLNLVGVHAAELSPQAQSFFGIVNRLFVFFSSSTSRWEVLKKHVPISLKSLSKTRWSARKESVDVFHKHLNDLNYALEELVESSLCNAETKAEARCLAQNICKFEFIVLTCFWSKMLQKIDRVNKYLQRDDVTVDTAVRHIKGLITDLESIRSNAPEDAISEARRIAESLDVPQEFEEKRKRKKKKMFDERCEDEISGLSQEDFFKVGLRGIFDSILNDMNVRFKALEEVNFKFSFLNGKIMNKMSVAELKLEAEKVADSYKTDLNKEELFQEVESFKHHAMETDDGLKTAHAKAMLQIIYKHGLQDAYPNLTTALKIFLTLPVTVASAERSFSKLKIVKNYLRSTMEQDRLSNLSIISIEHQRTSSISFDDIINTFAAKKARKVTI